MVLAVRAILVAVATATMLVGSMAPASAFGVVPVTGQESCDPGQLACTGGGSAAAAAVLLVAGAAVRRRD